MTEFRRATAAVESLEGCVAALIGSAASAAGAEPSWEERTQFVEAQGKLAELLPIAEKMRRKCEARAELEALKGKLRELLPGHPEDVLKVTQEAVDGGAEGSAALVPLLQQALELEGVATYGAKMVDKVQELLHRFDAAHGRLCAEVVPRLADAVASAAAADAARQAAEVQEAAARSAEEARREEEASRKAVAILLAESEERLKAQQARELEAERRRREDEEARRKAEAAAAAEEEALLRAEQDGELRLAEVGPDAACAEALAAMLAAPVGPYRAAVEALRGLLAGVAAEPQDARLRVIRLANEGFQQELGRRPGAWLFLRGVGFEPLTREVLPQGLLTSLGLGGGPPGERFLYLREPNMMEAYEEWQAWHERVKAIADFLHGLERLAFQRTAHLGQHGLDAATRTVLPAVEVMHRWEARGGA